MSDGNAAQQLNSKPVEDPQSPTITSPKATTESSAMKIPSSSNQLEIIPSKKSSPEPIESHEIDLDWSVPLPETIRPKRLRDYVGQDHLLGPEGRIHDFIRLLYLPSMILYGPPGVGKTTLASILARETGYVFVEFNATDGTIAHLKQLLTIIEKENIKRENSGEDYLLVVVFIDEIHRFRINQQDFLLPLIETGQFVFIGATTVNPKVKIRPAILSRCQVFELQSLSHSHLVMILDKAIIYENIRRRSVFNMNFLRFDQNLKLKLIDFCQGDSRKLISNVQFISVNLHGPEYEYHHEYKPVDVPNSIINLIEGFKPKVKLNGLYSNLFDLILNKAKVKINKNPNKNVDQQSKLMKINDKNDNYFRMDDPKFILLSDSKQQYEYSKQMEVSDNEYEGEGILSDTSLDYEDIQSNSPKFPLVKCLAMALTILKYEDPKRFLRNILLFCVIHVHDNSLLPKIMSMVKCVNTANVNMTKMFSNIIEKLYKSSTITKTKTIKFKIALIKRYLKTQPTQKPEIPDPVEDEDLLQSLLTPPKYAYEPVKGIEISDIDENVNLGILYGDEFDLLDEPLDSDSALTSISMMDFETDGSFMLMSDNSEG